MFNGYRYFIYICEEAVHPGRCAELALLDEEDCILHWFGVREEQCWMLGFPQKRILGFNGHSYGQGFQLAWGPKSAARFEFAGMEPHRNEFSSLDGIYCVTNSWRVLRGI